MTWLTVFSALWLYPVAGFFLLHWTRRKPRSRKYILLTVAGIAALSFLGLRTHVSSTVSALDWICATSVYLLLSLLLWYTQFQPNKWIKGIGVVAAALVFTTGYVCGTLGALGVGAVTSELDRDREVWLKDGLIYKEYSLGHATSDYRAKKVEVYQTLPWFPIVEWRIEHKEYDEWRLHTAPLQVDYRAAEKKLLLSASISIRSDVPAFSWADTLQLTK